MVEEQKRMIQRYILNWFNHNSFKIAKVTDISLNNPTLATVEITRFIDNAIEDKLQHMSQRE